MILADGKIGEEEQEKKREGNEKTKDHSPMNAKSGGQSSKGAEEMKRPSQGRVDRMKNAEEDDEDDDYERDDFSDEEDGDCDDTNDDDDVEECGDGITNRGTAEGKAATAKPRQSGRKRGEASEEEISPKPFTIGRRSSRSPSSLPSSTSQKSSSPSPSSISSSSSYTSSTPHHISFDFPVQPEVSSKSISHQQGRAHAAEDAKDENGDFQQERRRHSFGHSGPAVLLEEDDLISDQEHQGGFRSLPRRLQNHSRENESSRWIDKKSHVQSAPLPSSFSPDSSSSTSSSLLPLSPPAPNSSRRVQTPHTDDVRRGFERLARTRLEDLPQHNQKMAFLPDDEKKSGQLEILFLINFFFFLFFSFFFSFFSLFFLFLFANFLRFTQHHFIHLVESHTLVPDLIAHASIFHVFIV